MQKHPIRTHLGELLITHERDLPSLNRLTVKTLRRKDTSVVTEAQMLTSTHQ